MMVVTNDQTALKREDHKNRIIRLKEVLYRTGLSRGGVYARLGKDEFPKSISLGGRAVGFLESDIDDWINERIGATKEVVAR